MSVMRALTRLFVLSALVAPLTACGVIPGLGPEKASGPTAAHMALPLVSISSGAGVTCAISASGEAYCWGHNTNWVLGYGGAASAPYPVEVTPVEPLTRLTIGGTFLDSSLGGDPYDMHACAQGISGAAYCWGKGQAGQLGLGYDAHSSPRPGATPPSIPWIRTPHPVDGGPFRRLAAGWSVTCGIGVDDSTYCWGTLPGSVRHISPAPLDEDSYSFGQLSAGGSQVCALDQAGHLFCWGRNRWGVIDGSDPGPTVDEPLPTAVSPELNFRSVAVGLHHACALDADGRAFCWGRNDEGQLGNGSTEPLCGRSHDVHTCPSTSGGPRPLATSVSFSEITVGGLHTCALDRAGRAWCWGRRLEAQLGTGPEDNTVPQPVLTDLRFTDLTAGVEQTCGIALDGRAYCWGRNRWGELGIASKTDTLVYEPALVSGQSAVN